MTDEAIRPELTANAILKLAQERTGLTELDSDSWREGLQIVLDDIASPEVPDSGRDLVVGRCVTALATRLQLHAYVQEHPEVRNETIERPLFILGMPRTGTTVASYLLDQDPNRRSLLKWEAATPVPPPTLETRRTDPRCLAMKQSDAFILEYMKSSGGGLAHWEEADGPTECMFIHDQDFKGLLWDSFTPTTRYADWLLDEANVSSTYEYQKLFLQVLQSTSPGRWSLKMPSHSVHLAALLAVFPDAQLVWSHRDPFQASASLCNLLKLPGTMVLGEEGLDKEALGQNVKRQMREHVVRPLKVREQIGDERFFHLHYMDLLRDPMAQMKSLYEWIGEPLAPDVQLRMETWLADNPQHKHGVSAYTLSEYGLSVAELEPMFDEYLSAFDIELG